MPSGTARWVFGARYKAVSLSQDSYVTAAEVAPDMSTKERRVKLGIELAVALAESKHGPYTSIRSRVCRIEVQLHRGTGH